MIRWLKTHFRTARINSDPARLAGRRDRSLKSLRVLERRLGGLIEVQERQLASMQAELQSIREEMEWKADEARQTINRYSSEVDRLRDEISVNESTIRIQDAQFRRLLEQQKAETAIHVMRQMGTNRGDEIA